MPVWTSSQIKSAPASWTAASISRQRSPVEFVDALALDGLDDESRDVARDEFLLQGVEVTEGNLRRAREQRPEAVLELRGTIERQGARRETVVRVGVVDRPANAWCSPART